MTDALGLTLTGAVGVPLSLWWRQSEWARQATIEAPPGAVPVVVWRPSRAEWRVDLTLTDLLGILRP